MRNWFHEKDLLRFPLPKVTIEASDPEVATRMMLALKAELDPLSYDGRAHIDFDHPVRITGMEFVFKFTPLRRPIPDPRPRPSPDLRWY